MYRVHVVTSSERGSGTDSNIFLTLIGADGKVSEEVGLEHSQNTNKFESGATDVFNLNFRSHVGDLVAIRLRSDDAGMGSDWNLSSVTVFDTILDIECIFNCEKTWFKKDSKIQEFKNPSKTKQTTYTVCIKTSDTENAGTDSNVFLSIYGAKENIESTSMKQNEEKRNPFERGHTDTFVVKSKVSVGALQKVVVRADGSGLGSDWLLDSVVVSGGDLPGAVEFECGEWLTSAKPSAELLPGKRVGYRVAVVTGSESGSGTNSNVFVTLVGEGGESGEVALLKSEEHVDKFESGHTDTFVVKSKVSVGALQKVVVRADGSGLGSDWLLDSVVVSGGDLPGAVEFECGEWLTSAKPSAELLPGKRVGYRVAVVTGSESGSGTNSNVFVTLVGEGGESGEVALLKSEEHVDKFESGHTDTFVVKSKVSVGALQKVVVRADGSGLGSDWLLDSVVVSGGDLPGAVEFECGEWLTSAKPSAELLPGKRVGYRVAVVTGSESGSGTNSNVFVTLVGEGGESGEVALLKSEEHVDKFESGHTDTFVVKSKVSVGALQKVVVRADGSGLGSDWLLDSVVVSGGDLPGAVEFECGEWLTSAKPSAELLPGKRVGYRVAVVTGSESGSGTNSNVFVTLVGEGGESGEVALLKSEEHVDKFESGHTDTFVVKSKVSVGALQKVVVRADGSGLGSDWLLDSVVVSGGDLPGAVEFECGEWLTSAKPSAELLPGKRVGYRVAVVTGSESGSGTNSNVFVTLVGEGGESGEVALLKSEEHVDKFESGHTDTFVVKSKVSVGALQKVVVRADGSGLGSDWLLDSVVVSGGDLPGAVEFECGEWLTSAKPSAELLPGKRVGYRVAVVTGSESGSGTNSNVFVTLVGEGGESGEVALLKSEEHVDKFESGHTDTFVVKSKVSVGALQKVVVRADGSGLGSDWLLDSVVVSGGDLPGAVEFECGEWLTSAKPSAELLPGKRVGYRVAVVTGSESGSGTNSNVFVTLVGEGGESGEVALLKSEEHVDKFESGHTDTFVVKSKVSVGALQKVVVRADGSGLGSDWLLDSVVVSGGDLPGAVEFECGEWLTSAKPSAELLPGKRVGYRVAVVTGSESGSGTNSNVFVTLVGEGGESGEVALLKSEEHVDKFESGHTDTFVVKSKVSVGALQKVVVRADGSGLGSDWLLDSVVVSGGDLPGAVEFECGEWLTSAKPSAELLPGKRVGYRVAVVTGSESGSGTNSNVFVTLVGEGGESGEVALLKSEEHVDKFESGHTDTFVVKSKVSVGALQKVVVRADGSGLGSDWLLDSVVVSGGDLPGAVEFECGEWLTSAKPSAELLPGKRVGYRVAVVTGSESGSGTNSNVFVTLVGEGGESGEVALLKSEEHVDKFESGHTDTFVVKSKVSVGALQKVVVRADGSGLGSDWLLDSVVVSGGDLPGAVEFECGEWLTSAKPSAELLPGKRVGYRVAVVTGSESGSGTNSNVFVTLVGEGGESGEVALLKSEEHVDKFESGHTDTFVVKSKVSVGALQKVVVRADGSGLGSDWLLDSVVVSGGDLPGAVEFECGEWLTSAKPSAELLPGKRVGYRVAVVTGSESGSGTNSNVFVTLVGEGGESGEVALLKSEEHVDKFESGHTDTFVVKSKVSVGALQKVVVRADGSGLGSDWLLDSVVVSGGDCHQSVIFAGPVKICDLNLLVELFPQSVYSPQLFGSSLGHVDFLESSSTLGSNIMAGLASFESLFLNSATGAGQMFDVSDSNSLLDIISSLSVAIQSLNSASELLRSQVASVRAVVDSLFQDAVLSTSSAIQSSLAALCFKEKSLSQQLSAILSERAALRERHVRFSKLHLELTREPASSLKRSKKSPKASPCKSSVPLSLPLQSSQSTLPPLVEQQTTRSAISNSAVDSINPRLFQATVLSINQRHLVPYLLEALNHGKPEQQQRAMEIVRSLSDCRSNQNFLVDAGFAKAIALLGRKGFNATAVQSLVALLQFNDDAVRTARAQGVADSVASMASLIPAEQISSHPEIAELKAIFA
jgi:lipoxygenase homology domain-containing protein 1